LCHMVRIPGSHGTQAQANSQSHDPAQDRTNKDLFMQLHGHVHSNLDLGQSRGRPDMPSVRGGAKFDFCPLLSLSEGRPASLLGEMADMGQVRISERRPPCPL
jgi:hypothetical protein